MVVLDSGFLINGKEEIDNFKVSNSFKKELKRCLANELDRIFKGKLNCKKVYLQFIDNNSEAYRAPFKKNYFLVTSDVKNNQSFAPQFILGYNHAYSHKPKLIIENLIGDWPIIDPTKEVAPNSLKMTLEFDKVDFDSLQKFAEREERVKKGELITDYRFPVRVKNLNVDCEYKIYPDEELICIERFEDYLENVISEYNQKTENDTHEEIIVLPNPKEYEPKVFDEEGIRNYFKMFFMKEYSNDSDKTELISKGIDELVEEQRIAVENYNAKIGQIPEPYSIKPEGLIHNFNMKEKKNAVITFRLDLGSSSHGFEYILKKLDESDFPISKVEIKGF